MNIPEKVRIGGMNYEIQYEERLLIDNKALLGKIVYDQGIIKLEPKIQNEQGMKQTLFHEIMHGIAIHFGLSVNDDEDTIDKLAKGLYMVIEDNPDMFKSEVKI